MTGNDVLQTVLDELAAPAGAFHPDWSDVERRALPGATPARRGPSVRRPPRLRARLLAVALAALVVLGVGVAIAATTDLLQGPPAAPENDRALRQLFPPLDIGPATELASHGERTLFGARTRRGGYCFSATSPTDPRGEGGHCVSDVEARTLDRRGVVAFAMSGSSVGGFAPGAEYVRVSGAGMDVELPVAPAGWWVGEARLPDPPLPSGVEQANVVATAYRADGTLSGRDPLLRVRRLGGFKGGAYQILFV